MENLPLTLALELLDDIINVVIEIIAETESFKIQLNTWRRGVINLLVSNWASSHRRNAPIVASSGLSTTFMLMTCTGVSVTESLELKHSKT